MRRRWRAAARCSLLLSHNPVVRGAWGRSLERKAVRAARRRERHAKRVERSGALRRCHAHVARAADGKLSDDLAQPRGVPKGGINGCPEEGINGNWRCGGCFNINFGHRSECNRCKAQKPAE